jgi:hypothetical protein
MHKPTWKNTLYYDNGIWLFLSDFVAAACSVGYPFALWHDGKVYTYTRDKYNFLVVEPTEFTEADVKC